MRTGRAVIAACAAVVVSMSAVATAKPRSGTQRCQAWTIRTIASGLGVLENLTFDGHGSLFISATQSGAIERMTPDGRITTLVPNVSYPGGLVVRGDLLYFNTGNSPQAGVLGTYDGTIDTFNLDTGARTIWSRKLVMPNGLAFLPDGSAVVTRIKPVLETPTGMTRITPADPTDPEYNWVPLSDTNAPSAN